MKIVGLGLFLTAASSAGGLLLIGVKGGTPVLFSLDVWTFGVQTLLRDPGAMLRLALGADENATLILGLMLTIGGVLGMAAIASLSVIVTLAKGVIAMGGGRPTRKERTGPKTPEGAVRRKVSLVKTERTIEDLDLDGACKAEGLASRMRSTLGATTDGIARVSGLARRLGVVLSRVLVRLAEMRGKHAESAGPQGPAPAPETTGQGLDVAAIDQFRSWYEEARSKNGNQLDIARRAVDLAARMGPAERALVIEADAIAGDFMLRMLDSWARRARGQVAATTLPAGTMSETVDAAVMRSAIRAAQAARPSDPEGHREDEIVNDLDGETPEEAPDPDEIMNDIEAVLAGREIDIIEGDGDGFPPPFGPPADEDGRVRGASGATAEVTSWETEAQAWGVGPTPPGGPAGWSLRNAMEERFTQVAEVAEGLADFLDQAEAVARGETIWEDDLEEPELRLRVFDQLYAAFKAVIDEANPQAVLEEAGARRQDRTWAWIRANLMGISADPESYRQRVLGQEDSGSGWMDGGLDDGSLTTEGAHEEALPEDDGMTPWEDGRRGEHAPEPGSDGSANETPEALFDQAESTEDALGAGREGPPEKRDGGSDDAGEDREVLGPAEDADPEPTAEERTAGFSSEARAGRDIGLPEIQEVEACGSIIARWGVSARRAGASEATVGRGLYTPDAESVFRSAGVVQVAMAWRDEAGRVIRKLNVITRYLPEGRWRIVEEAGIRILNEEGDFVTVSERLLAHPEIIGQFNVLHLHGPGAADLTAPGDIAGVRIVTEIMDPEGVTGFVMAERA